MVERRKPQLRAEREARLADALRRNLRRRKEAAGEAAPTEEPTAESALAAGDRPGWPERGVDER